MPNQRSVSTGSLSSCSSSGSRTSKKRPPVFPKRLYDMLENAESDGYAHVISWMPDGKSFKIHNDGSRDKDNEKLIVEVLKKSFNQTRFKSFLRQLQLYGFERTYKGPQRGQCKHELFVRGRRDLLHKRSIEDFQRKANDTSHRSPKSVRKFFQSPTPTEVPSCQSLTSNSGKEGGCQYLKNSIIPTRLINLVLPDNDSSSQHSDLSNDCELSTPDNCASTNNNVQTASGDASDVISIHSDDVPSWTGMEIEMLRYATL